MASSFGDFPPAGVVAVNVGGTWIVGCSALSLGNFNGGSDDIGDWRTTVLKFTSGAVDYYVPVKAVLGLHK